MSKIKPKNILQRKVKHSKLKLQRSLNVLKWDRYILYSGFNKDVTN